VAEVRLGDGEGAGHCCLYGTGWKLVGFGRRNGRQT
jgi:hypothetical protein